MRCVCGGTPMYLLSTRRERIELLRLDADVLEDSAIGAARSGPPPVVFRDVATGLLHVAHRELVVRFVHTTPERRRRDILGQGGFRVRRVNPFIQDQLVVYDPEGRQAGEDLVEVSNRWMELDEIVFASPSFFSQFHRQGPPSIRAEEWHLENTGDGETRAGEDVSILSAWEKTPGDPRIVVAVLDDGVDVEHPNLKGNIWKNPEVGAKDVTGRDFFVSSDSPEHFDPRPKRFQLPYDRMAGNDIHGTPCAGIIAARGESGGSVGAAPGCRILPVKIFHAGDLASGENVANAIRYAAIHADVLCCSWVSGIDPDIEQALADAGVLGREGRGAVLFCAAGNGFGKPVRFPASDPNAIAVGASTDQGKRAPYSNTGPELAFVAPSSGGTRGIFTTSVSFGSKERNEDGLHTHGFGGTSAASALAAGVGALVLSVNPGLDRSDLREIMKSTAVKIGSGYDSQGHSDDFGHGRIDAGKAVFEVAALKGQG